MQIANKRIAEQDELDAALGAKVRTLFADYRKGSLERHEVKADLLEAAADDWLERH